MPPPAPATTPAARFGSATLPARPLGRSGIVVSALGFGGAPLGDLYGAARRRRSRSPRSRRRPGPASRCSTRRRSTGAGLRAPPRHRPLRRRPARSFVPSTKVGRVYAPAPNGVRNREGYVGGLPFEGRFDYSRDGCLRSLEQSLLRLGVASVDIAPCTTSIPAAHGDALDERIREVLDGAWRALAELARTGRRAGDRPRRQRRRVCARFAREADLDCVMLAGRYSLLEQPALAFLELAKERGIGVMLGGVFNSGILATGAVRGAKYDYRDAPPDVLARVARIGAVCRAHGVALAHAAVQFPLGHPAVSSVVLGAVTPAEVARNVDAFARPVPAALWDDLVAAAAAAPTRPCRDDRRPQHFWRLARGDYGWLTPSLAPIFRDFGPRRPRADPRAARHRAHDPRAGGTDGCRDGVPARHRARHAFRRRRRRLGGFRRAGCARRRRAPRRGPAARRAAADGAGHRRRRLAGAAVACAGVRGDDRPRPRVRRAGAAAAPVAPRARAGAPPGTRGGGRPPARSRAIREREIEGWRADLATVATHRQAHCKLSGLVIEALAGRRDWTCSRRTSTRCSDCSAPSACCWGSDWPVVEPPAATTAGARSARGAGQPLCRRRARPCSAAPPRASTSTEIRVRLEFPVQRRHANGTNGNSSLTPISHSFASLTPIDGTTSRQNGARISRFSVLPAALRGKSSMIDHARRRAGSARRRAR
ncbi:MAG: aldo/keto reductase [Comamonadaceae bacterium]|nr:aldo/keto reductase [Comamonadaceae bacterium]